MTNNEDENIIFFKQTHETTERKLKEIFTASQNKAINLSAILSICNNSNNYHFLYEYLYSEIDSEYGFLEFCEKIKINPSNLRSFFREKTAPDIQLLSRILNGLGFNLSIKAISE